MDPIMQFFTYEHLQNDELKAVSKPFCDLAQRLVGDDGGRPLTPRNPERTVALRKLLEAKDAAVRAFLFESQITPPQ